MNALLDTMCNISNYFSKQNQSLTVIDNTVTDNNCLRYWYCLSKRFNVLSKDGTSQENDCGRVQLNKFTCLLVSNLLDRLWNISSSELPIFFRPATLLKTRGQLFLVDFRDCHDELLNITKERGVKDFGFTKIRRYLCFAKNAKVKSICSFF